MSISNNLIRGVCFINGVSLISIIDTGATHSFISNDCIIKLNPIMSSMKGNMAIDTLANGLVTTSLVFLNCRLSIYSKYFRVNLICLPLSQLDVILGLI